jgi:hypothetical protein
MEFIINIIQVIKYQLLILIDVFVLVCNNHKKSSTLCNRKPTHLLLTLFDINM